MVKKLGLEITYLHTSLLLALNDLSAQVHMQLVKYNNTDSRGRENTGNWRI